MYETFSNNRDFHQCSMNFIKFHQISSMLEPPPFCLGLPHPRSRWASRRPPQRAACGPPGGIQAEGDGIYQWIYEYMDIYGIYIWNNMKLFIMDIYGCSLSLSWKWIWWFMEYMDIMNMEYGYHLSIIPRWFIWMKIMHCGIDHWVIMPSIFLG